MRLDALLLIAGRGIQAVLTVALFRVITHFLEPAQIGGVYLMFSVAYLFTSFLVNPVSTYIGRKFFHWYDEKNIFRHLVGYNYYLAAVSALAVPLVWLLWRFFGVGAGLGGWTFAAEVACYIYVLAWNVTIVPMLNSLGYRASFVLFSVAAAGLGLVFSPALVIWGAPTGEYWMAGQIAALAAVNAAAVLHFRKRVPEPPGPAPLDRYFGRSTLAGVGEFALPIAVSAFFMWAQGQSYRVIVDKMSGPEFLGYLGVGFSIATSVAGIMESLVQQFYFPAFYRRITAGGKEERSAALSDLAAQALPVYVVYLFFLVGLAEPLVRVLVDEKYRAVFVFARYGAFVEFFRMVTNTLSMGFYSEMRTKGLLKPYFFGGLSAVLGVYLALLTPIPETLVPTTLALSGLLSVVVMGSRANAVNPFNIDAGVILKTVSASLLFLPFALFRPGGVLWDVGLITIAGIYFVLLQYWHGRKWFGAKNVFLGSKQSILPPENISQAEL